MELLDRLYDELAKKTTPSNNKLTIDAPIVACANKRTYVSNFAIICNKLNRKESDILQYFTEELNTAISIDQNGCLIICGIFKQAGIQKIFGNYIKEYIICKECHSYNTELIKENRITFLSCNKCLSKKAL